MGAGEPSNVTDCFAIVKSLSITSNYIDKGTVNGTSVNSSTSYYHFPNIVTVRASTGTAISDLEEVVKDAGNLTAAGFTAGGTTYAWTNDWDFTDTWRIEKGYNGGYPMLKGFVYEIDLTDTTVTLSYKTNNGNDVFVYVLDANKDVVRQIVLNGTSGEQNEITFVVTANQEFTLFVYQSLYMVTTIDGETVTKKAYVPTSDTLGITLSVSLPAQAVGNWVTV